MKETLADFYLEFLNNYLTIRVFALHNQMTEEDAQELLAQGRKYHIERTTAPTEQSNMTNPYQEFDTEATPQQLGELGELKLKVLLASVGNPDKGEDPNRSLYRAESTWVYCKTLQEASDLCSQYIRDYELGGGNWAGGEVRKLFRSKGEAVAQVSYNGRVWVRKPA